MSRTDQDLQHEDDLERALGDMFARRSHDITTAAALPDAPTTDTQVVDELAARRARARRRYAAVAAAACVVAVAAGVVIGDRLRRDERSPVGTSPVSPTSAPSPNSTTPQTAPRTTCRVEEPAAWTRAIGAAALRLDSPTTQPLAAAGDVLVADQNNSDGTSRELAVFDAAGRGTTIWRPESGQTQTPVLAQSGAIDDDRIVFATIQGQTQNPVAVYAWDRAGGGSARAVRVLSDSELLQDNRVLTGAPVVSGNTAYWIEQTYRQDDQQTVHSLDLSAAGAEPRQVATVADVSQLIVLPDGSLGYVHADGSLTGDRVPASITGASRGGTGYGLTADGLRWLVPTGQPSGPSILRTWSGGTSLTSQQVPALGVEPVIAGPFVAPATSDPGSAQPVFDTRSGALVTLAAGRSLTVASDRFAAVGVAGRSPSKFGTAGVSRPSLSALPAARC